MNRCVMVRMDFERQMPEAHLIKHTWSIQFRRPQRKHRE
jgi:hypothetical protein